MKKLLFPHMGFSLLPDWTSSEDSCEECAGLNAKRNTYFWPHSFEKYSFMGLLFMTQELKIKDTARLRRRRKIKHF